MREKRNEDELRARTLKREIEVTRASLDALIEEKAPFELYYPVSLRLDRLIEQYHRVRRGHF